jgi:hypothetical protein
MKAVVNICFLIALILTGISTAHGQQETPKYEVGVKGGIMVYQGDLVPGAFGNFKTVKPAFGVSVSRSLDPYLSIRTNVAFSRLSSDESLFTDPPYRKRRNFSFSTPITEFTALLVFNPFGQHDGDTRKLAPYIFAGAGMAFLNITRDWSRVDTSTFHSGSSVATGLAIDTVKQVPKSLFALAAGAGIRYNITSLLSVNAEAMFRFTGSDYIDGFKYAANPKNKDNYYGISIGIGYKLAAGNETGGNGGRGGRGRYKCPDVN